MQRTALQITGEGRFREFPATRLRALLLAAFFLCFSLSGTAADSEVQATPLPRVERELLLGFLANPDSLTLLDARSPEEYSAQHLPGARNIPFDALDSHLDALPSDKDKAIVIYCRTGRRAGLLRDALLERGYTDVQVLPQEQIFWNDNFMAFNCSTEIADPLQASQSVPDDSALTGGVAGK
jgi:rhodanese-related sulfurtransferase